MDYSCGTTTPLLGKYKPSDVEKIYFFDEKPRISTAAMLEMYFREFENKQCEN